MGTNRDTRIPVFPENSRVCFLGDSLTASSLWVEIIFEYYQKKFPGKNIRVYDAGSGGGSIGFAMNYLEEDIMTLNPTHVVVMYCANDFMHYEGTVFERALAFLADVRRVTEYFKERGIEVYYGIEPKTQAEDQGKFTPRDAGWMVMKTVAEEYDTGYFDLYSNMSDIIFNNDDMVVDDLVHFTNKGENVVAKLFLHSQGFEEFSPDRDDFFDKIELSELGKKRWAVNDKIRRIWMAEVNVLGAVIGAPVEKKMERLKERIPTRADGAWDDFCYGRALDWVEFRPHLDEYKKELEEITEEMTKV